MANRNDSLTVETFNHRYTLVSPDDMEALRNGEERTFTANVGWKDQSDGPAEWAYVSLVPLEEVNNLDEFAYFNNDGEYVVDYSDISENLTDCTLSSAVVSDSFIEGRIHSAEQILARVRTGKKIKFEASLTEDDDGVEYINVQEVLSIESAEEADDVSFELEVDHQPEEVPEA